MKAFALQQGHTGFYISASECAEDSVTTFTSL